MGSPLLNLFHYMVISKVKKDLFFLVLILVLSIPTFSHLIRSGYFFMQDDLQAFRTLEMDKCIKDGQIPCRWVPDAGYGYGYPQFNYYPPMVYYLSEGFHLIGFQFIDAVKIVFALGYVLSAFAMYFLVKEIFTRWEGFVSAILYTYIPYKAVEVYVRGAMSEFWSLVFFPLIFLFSYQLIKTGKKTSGIALAISLGLLLTTHNLMPMVFLPAYGIWTKAVLTI